MSLKDDEFFAESDKIKKFQGLLKSEFNKRKLILVKNESTALVPLIKLRLMLGSEENSMSTRKV